jgi:hypothetical protein
LRHPRAIDPGACSFAADTARRGRTRFGRRRIGLDLSGRASIAAVF